MELEKANNDLVDLHKQVTRAEALLAEYYCPICNAPLHAKDTDVRGIVVNGEPELEFHEVSVFECGCEIVNGVIERRCEESD